MGKIVFRRTDPNESSLYEANSDKPWPLVPKKIGYDAARDAIKLGMGAAANPRPVKKGDPVTCRSCLGEGYNWAGDAPVLCPTCKGERVVKVR